MCGQQEPSLSDFMSEGEMEFDKETIIEFIKLKLDFAGDATDEFSEGYTSALLELLSDVSTVEEPELV